MGSLVSRYVYDQEDILLEYDGSNTLLRSYTHGSGIDEPLSVTSHQAPVTSYYYHTDALGSVTSLTDSSGTTIESYSYSSFGTPSFFDSTGASIPQSAIRNPHLFTSREYDPESSLYYFRARYYDPVIGRFLQEDPVFSTNLYPYAGNNPLNLTDPTGEIAPFVTVGGAILIAGTLLGAIFGGVGARQAGQSVSLGTLRGSVQGAFASGVGAFVGGFTRNPAAIGAASSATFNATGQGFDVLVTLQSQSINRGSILTDTFLGALFGPLVNGLVPLRGPAPNLSTLRTFRELLNPNTLRLLAQEGIGTFLNNLLGGCPPTASS